MVEEHNIHSEAIYNDCILILHKEWVEAGDLFKDKHNCYVVGYTDKPEEEIAKIINNPNKKMNKMILKNSKIILNSHIKKDFFRFFFVCFLVFVDIFICILDLPPL